MDFEKKITIPVVESDVFKNHPDARFAIGEVAINNMIVNGYINEFNGAAKLRVNTYLESGFIKSDDLNDNGTELDDNDTRSVHFVMLERTAVESLARVIGNMRLIIRSSDNPEPLPVEEFFPEHFAENPIPIGGVEVSRLIARHEDAEIQNALKWPMFVAGHNYVDVNQLGPVYGLLSPALTRLLRSQYIPASALTAAKYIEAINATKHPVSINLPVLKRVIKQSGDQDLDVSSGGFAYLETSKIIKGAK